MSNIKSIATYCSSSDQLDAGYFELASSLGKEMGCRKMTLVYGGSTAGMMGRMAKETKQSGGKVLAVFPDFKEWEYIHFQDADETHSVKTFSERKAKFNELADAFLILPGGFGTLDELFDILALKIIVTHQKPIVILNYNGFYDNLLKFLDELFAKKLANQNIRPYYHVANTINDVFVYLEKYTPPIEMKMPHGG